MRRFRFEWFDELDQHEYKAPSGFLLFKDSRWMKAPYSFWLGQLSASLRDSKATGEAFLRTVRGAPYDRFLVPYDERGFVLLAAPEGYDLEEDFPSNPPLWLRGIREEIRESPKTFWERL